MKKRPKSVKLKAKDNPEVDRLAGLIGDFIEYWGFKKTHGKIWAYLHFSLRPLSTQELIDLVGVSKGAISRALDELSRFQVIERKAGGLNGMVYYEASSRVTLAISEILKTRELKLLNEISDALRKAQENKSFSSHAPIPLSSARADEVGTWINLAHSFLNQVVQMTQDHST